MNAIEIKNLTKKYGDITAVNKLSLSIEEDSLFALLGINGAGKTTTIKMLSCLTAPSEGDALLNGYSIVTNRRQVKEIIGVSPQETAVAPNLSARENLKLMARIYGCGRADAEKAANESIERLSLGEIADQKAKTLSGGWQRRLSIAMAIISRPKILFLDEPTLGLDVIARRELWDTIKEIKKESTVILTTHYLEEAEALADKIGIMSKGVLKACGTAAQLKEAADTDDFEETFIRISASKEGCS